MMKMTSLSFAVAVDIGSVINIWTSLEFIEKTSGFILK